MSTVERYLEYMGIEIDDLRGKLILDVGAGYAGFAIECAEEDIARVVSLDVNPDRHSLHQLRWQEKSTPVICGRSCKLPFIDAIFDLVVSNIAVPMLCESKEAVDATLEEMCRVVKPGGEVRIVSIIIHRRDDVEEWIRDKLLEIVSDRDKDYEVIRTSWFKTLPEFPGKAAEHCLCIIKKNVAPY